jgi:hypothetical protein
MHAASLVPLSTELTDYTGWGGDLLQPYSYDAATRDAYCPDLFSNKPDVTFAMQDFVADVDAFNAGKRALDGNGGVDAYVRDTFGAAAGHATRVSTFLKGRFEGTEERLREVTNDLLLGLPWPVSGQPTKEFIERACRAPGGQGCVLPRDLNDNDPNAYNAFVDCWVGKVLALAV